MIPILNCTKDTTVTMPMRWKVYRDDNLMGEMTSAEIRQALREGRLDPFDKVSSERSVLRLDILEVDEIFLTEEKSLAKVAGNPREFSELSIDNLHDETMVSQVRSPQQVHAAPMRSPAPAAPVNQVSLGSFADIEQPPPRMDSSVPISSMGADNAEWMHRDQQERIRKKIFYLLDKSDRRLGPLSASEIQSLFYRGILDQNLTVQKMGESKRVPLRTFLSGFATKQIQQIKALNRGGGRAQVGQQMRAWNISALVNEMHKGMMTKKLVHSRGVMFYIIMLLLGLLIGIGTVTYRIMKPTHLRRVPHERTMTVAAVQTQLQTQKLKGVPVTPSSTVVVAPPEPLAKKGNHTNSLVKIEEAPQPIVVQAAVQKKPPKVPPRPAKKPHSVHAVEHEQAEAPAVQPPAATSQPQPPSPSPVARPAKKVQKANKKQPKVPKPPALSADTEEAAPAAEPSHRETPAAQRRDTASASHREATPAPHRDTAPTPHREATAQPPREAAPASSGRAVAAVPSVPVVTSRGVQGGAPAGGIADLAKKDGQVVTTAPVRFNKQSLEQCPLKCTLIFQYGNGTGFLGVFFKGAYLDQLNQSPGTVRVTGRVKSEGGRYTIFVQGIR